LPEYATGSLREHYDYSKLIHKVNVPVQRQERENTASTPSVLLHQPVLSDLQMDAKETDLL
jgi:hypothetical protein